MPYYSIDELRRIITPIASAHGVESVSVFGSYSKGNTTADSDVDLKIEKGHLRSLFTIEWIPSCCGGCSTPPGRHDHIGFFRSRFFGNDSERRGVALSKPVTQSSSRKSSGTASESQIIWSDITIRTSACPYCGGCACRKRDEGLEHKGRKMSALQ